MASMCLIDLPTKPSIEVLAEEETTALEIVRWPPRRVASTDESDIEQRVEDPDAALTASGTTVVPYLVHEGAFLTPRLAHTTHATRVGCLFGLGSDEPECHKLFTGRDGLPRIKVTLTVCETPRKAESGGVRHVLVQYYRQPTATSEEAAGRVGHFDCQSILAVLVGIVKAITGKVADRNEDLVLTERTTRNDGFPHRGLLPAHAAATIPDRIEFRNLLHLDLDTGQNTVGDLNLLLAVLVRPRPRL